MHHPAHQLAAAALALSLLGCGQTGSQVSAAHAPGPTGEAVVLGAVYCLTGPQAVLDVPSARGAQLAVDLANARGGTLGRPVQLIVRDGESRPDAVAAATAALVAAPASACAVLGLSDSDLVRAAAPATVDAGRVFLTSGATSPKLPPEVPGPLFLACFGDNVQAAAAAEWLYEEDPEARVAVLYDDTHVYTRLLQGYFSQAWQELGGTITSTTPLPTGGEVSDSAALDAIDIVFLSAETAEDAVRLASQLRAAGFAGRILGGDGYDAPNVWAAHAELSDVYFTTHAWLDPEAADERVLAFRQAWNTAWPAAEPDGFAALGFDATNLVLRAIEDAGSTEPQAVARALGAIRSFKGVTGTMTYRPGQHVPVKTVFIVSVASGVLSLAAERQPRKVPAP